MKITWTCTQRWNTFFARFSWVIVTDSGTFQSYVYGDVEVGVEEIVEFQKKIGVDIGTMLDVFGRPDMSREEIEHAVQETANRIDIIEHSRAERSEWARARVLTMIQSSLALWWEKFQENIEALQYIQLEA